MQPSFQRFATIALVLATVPKTVAAYTGQKWQHAALKRYDKAFIAGDFRRPRTWVMRQGATSNDNGAPAPNQEAVRTALFKERLRWGVAGTVDASRQLIDDVSLAVINGAFFGLAMGPQLTAAMVVAMGLTQGLGWASRASKAEANRAREAAYTDAFAEGLKVWDNLVLGNPMNRDPWLRDLTRARHAWVYAGAREQSAQLQRAWLGSAVAGGPVLLAAAHHAMALSSQGGPQALASEFLPVLPRLLSVVSNANALRNTVWDRFVGTRQGRLDTLQAARERPTLDTEALLKHDWITISHNNGPERPLPTVAADLHNAISQGKPGRWTIRGRNTAGKSMTLLGLKEAGANAPALSADIAPGAFLLPAKSRLSFAFQTGSSGETGLAHVRETLQRGPQVLMFDECAAHLDEANSVETDRMLDAAAQKRTIVDIRHR